eukprot:TRINITY_DN21175_c0_g1_i1.p1 TRINITY_DN21175_c0_g1~~TRINITY_DN21175_c0_g1_i1.p1  ORF type:complete len:887 (+),score=135.49 TRINITY_DN21175_c0_g1_i1:62-2662(+)
MDAPRRPPSKVQACIDRSLKGLVEEQTAGFQVFRDRLRELEDRFSLEIERFAARLVDDLPRQGIHVKEEPETHPEIGTWEKPSYGSRQDVYQSGGSSLPSTPRPPTVSDEYPGKGNLRKSVAARCPGAGHFKVDPHETDKVPTPPTRSRELGVFVDAETMKERVRQNIAKAEHNVADQYKITGLFQMVARHSVFENLTLLIIGVNAIWIWVETDYNPAEVYLNSSVEFQVADNILCVYFTLEWFIRFNAFSRKLDCLTHRSFLFDSALVALMVTESWVMTAVLWLANMGKSAGYGDASILRVLRLLRLTRMARMARLLRAIPELMIMVKGISVAARSVFFTLLFLVAVLYIFGIAFAQLTQGTTVGKARFSSVPHSMSTLLLHGCFGEDLPDVAHSVGDENILLAALLMLFVLLASLTIMNMLVGVLVEVVSVVSKVEKEELIVTFVKDQLQHLLESTCVDTDGNGLISREEFELLMLKPEASHVLKDVGVDVVGLIDFMDYIYSSSELAEEEVELSFSEFMDVILQLRGCNTATVKDIVDLRKFMLERFESAEARPQSPPEKTKASIVDDRVSEIYMTGPVHSRGSIKPRGGNRKNGSLLAGLGLGLNHSSGNIDKIDFAYKSSSRNTSTHDKQWKDSGVISNIIVEEFGEPAVSLVRPSEFHDSEALSCPTRSSSVDKLPKFLNTMNMKPKSQDGLRITACNSRPPSVSRCTANDSTGDKPTIALWNSRPRSVPPFGANETVEEASRLAQTTQSIVRSAQRGQTAGWVADMNGDPTDPPADQLPVVTPSANRSDRPEGPSADERRLGKHVGVGGSPREPARRLVAKRGPQPWVTSSHQRMPGLQPRQQLLPPPATAAMWGDTPE